MFKNFGLITLTLAAGTLLYGCATYKTTLTDAQGKSVTCEASGHAGIVTGQYLKAGFDECVKNAEAQGFKQNDATAK